MFLIFLRNGCGYRIVSLVTSILFLSLSPGVTERAQAAPLALPAPDQFITATPPVSPPLLKGIQLYPQDPLTFDFIIDEGDKPLDTAAFQKETTRLIKYFLAGLTIPDDELWVNLSPYEKDRVATEALGLFARSG